MNTLAPVKAKKPNMKSAIERMGEGTYGKEVDRVDWPYYDELTLTAGVNEYTLFNQSQGKTLAQTNYFGNGIFPQAQEFRIKALKIEYLAAGTKTSADIISLYKLLWDSTLQFQIQNKPPSYQKTMFEAMGIPMGFHVTPGVAGDNESIMSYGRFLGIDPLNRQIFLAALTPWTTKINFYGALPAALLGDRIRISWNGILRRLV